MGEETGLGDAVAERNILYDRLVPVEWGEITTILVNDVSSSYKHILVFTHAQHLI